jgi:hypothetical protein
MDNTTDILKWGSDYLTASGHIIELAPEIVLSTPWSTMIRFSTTTGDFYLKQTPAAISKEPQIIQLLSDKFHASVPDVIASNTELHCFLMRDAGKVLRAILKEKFSSDLFCRAIKEYGELQRATENDVEAFIQLGVPDWRLNKLPMLYDQLLNEVDFLKAYGMIDEELQKLQELRPQLLAQCELLASYGIPETIGIPDFNDNNTLFDLNTKKMTFIDWGEAAITHPFFSIYNCLEQAINHHGVKEADQIYRKLQDACQANWSDLVTRDQILEVFNLAMQLRIIYGILGCYRLMVSVDLQALNTFYANKPNRLAKAFRKYIDSCTKL